MQHVRYSDILETLSGLDSWLQSLGLEPKNDRIHQAVEIVRRAEEGKQKARRTGEPTKIGNVSDFYFGLIEALEFYDIFRAFKVEPAAVLHPKLSRALSGPLRPADETKKNTDARNTLFELALAAEWRLQGANVLIGEPDITLYAQGIPYLVECKRPFRTESIRPNARSAAEQLKNRLEDTAAKSAMGIIAISVSRILNPGTKIFRAPTESARELLGTQLEKMMRENERHWIRLQLHPRIVGILFHVATPAVVENKDQLVRMAYTVLSPVATEGPAFNVLREELPKLYPR